MTLIEELQSLRAEIAAKLDDAQLLRLDRLIAQTKNTLAGYKAALTKGPEAMAEAGRKAAATRRMN